MKEKKPTITPSTKRLVDQAVVNSLEGVVAALAEADVDINGRDRDGRTALISAVIHQNIEMAKRLIDYKADINLQDKGGWTALHFAAQKGELEMVKLLFKAGASLSTKDLYGNTPLSRAVFAYQGQGGIITFMLQNGALPDEPNNSGISPRQLANQIANYDVKQFFT